MRPNEHNILQNILNKSDLSKFKQPDVIIEDYSNFYVKLVPNHNKGGLAQSTILDDSIMEHFKWFHNFLEKNEEMCLYMNDLLEKNPYFPLDPPLSDPPFLDLPL